MLIEGSYVYFINIQFSYRQSKFPSSFSVGNANLILEIQLNLKGENMKIADAITYCLQYHKINSRPNTLANYKFLLGKLGKVYSDRGIDSISTERIIAFLANLTEGRKQNTKWSKDTTLSAFFNLIINPLQPEMKTPCLSPAAKALFHKPKTTHWIIFYKDTIDEVIFRTLNSRNRLILELMARGGMRISEVLGLKPTDIDGQKHFCSILLKVAGNRRLLI